VGRERWADEDRGQQRGHFFFEACKHFTTLSTASALVVVVLNQRDDLYLWPLAFFGFSLLCTTYGMVALALRGGGSDGFSEARSALLFGIAGFLLGLVAAFLGAVGSP
jgi:tellurite resistance protein TehA-like permease